MATDKTCRAPACEETIPAESRADYCPDPACIRERNRQRQAKARRLNRERVKAGQGQHYPRRKQAPKGLEPRAKFKPQRIVHPDDPWNDPNLPHIGVEAWINSYGMGGPRNPYLHANDIANNPNPPDYSGVPEEYEREYAYFTDDIADADDTEVIELRPLYGRVAA